MALPDSVKIVTGTSFIFAFDTDWPASPTQGWSATVDAEIDMTVPAAGAAQQSAKCDLTANRDVEYKVEASVETDIDPAANDTIDFYVGYSDSVTAGTGNPAQLSGTDSAYSGGSAGTLDEGLLQLEFIGSIMLQIKTDTDNEPQVAVIATIQPKAQYMMLVVVNNCTTATLGAAGVGDECAVRVTGQTVQIQD